MYFLVKAAVTGAMPLDERKRLVVQDAAARKILTQAGYGLLPVEDPTDHIIETQVTGIILQKGWHSSSYWLWFVARCAYLDKTFYWYEEGATTLVRLGNESVRKALAVGRNTTGEYIDKLLK